MRSTPHLDLTIIENVRACGANLLKVAGRLRDFGQCDNQYDERARILIQPKRLDCGLVDRSGNEQTLVALIIRQGRSRLYVERAGYRTKVVTGILQHYLNIRDDLIGQQIAVSIDRSVLIVIIVARIIAPGWIPIASVQKVISPTNQNDGVTMLSPPIAIVPFVPMTSQGVEIAGAIIFALLIPPRCRLDRCMFS